MNYSLCVLLLSSLSVVTDVAEEVKAGAAGLWAPSSTSCKVFVHIITVHISPASPQGAFVLHPAAVTVCWHAVRSTYRPSKAI